MYALKVSSRRGKKYNLFFASLVQKRCMNPIPHEDG